MWRRIPERIYLLEIAKLGGMLLWCLASCLKWFVTPNSDMSVNSIVSYELMDSLSGYITICLLYFLLLTQNNRKIIPKKGFAYMLIPISYLSSLLWNILSNVLNYFQTKKFILIDDYFFPKSIFSLTPILAFIGLFYLINHWLNLKKQKEMTLIATNLANEAQLQMLRYQINPHFLFNALNTIRLMVEEDKTIARKMITELANFFRYSLSQNGTTDTFENEINAIKNYLEIQKIRFEEKLIVIYDIDEKLLKMKIPFFIVLPLVENAIKFGLKTSAQPLTIKVYAKANDHLEISIQNTGKLVESTMSIEGTKTGIANTKKRLSLYFHDNYSFNLFEKDSWVISQIIIKDYKNQLLV